MTESNVTLKQVIKLIQKVLNYMDPRLLDHGEKVAYILYKLLKVHKGYTDEEIYKLCTIAIFHDIGAYKVTERDDLLDIETNTPINHAVYGALFIKYFSPLGDLNEVVLGHHLDSSYFEKEREIVIPKEALMLGLADSIALIHLKDNEIKQSWLETKKKEYLEENVGLFQKVNKDDFISTRLSDNRYKEELYSFFGRKVVYRDEIIAYAKMLAYSIDFMSESTLKHTIVVEAVSYEVAKLSGMSEEAAIRIKIAATIHDIGKIAIPIEILEKPGKLTTEEFEIIKSHAIIGYKILSDLNIDDIRDIASAHHEKLDGTGYPFGLKGNEICEEARIVAVSDILSALMGVRSYKNEFNKEKIIEILRNMVENNKIDSHIVNLVIENYDDIIGKVNFQTDELMSRYVTMKKQYKILLSKLDSNNF